MPMGELWRLFRSILWRKARELTRYRIGFALELGSILTFTGGMLLFVPFYATPTIVELLGTSEAMSYILLGAGFLPLYGIAMWESADQFQEEVATGLIDYTLAAPLSLYKYAMALIIASAAVIVGINAVPVFGAAVVLAPHAGAAGIVGAVVVILLTCVLLTQLGAIFSSAVLLYRGLGALVRLVNVLLQFLTGMMIPVLLLPGPLREVALWMPMTAGLDLARHYLLGARLVAGEGVEWGVLIGELGVCTVAAAWLTRLVEKRIRRDGSRL